MNTYSEQEVGLLNSLVGRYADQIHELEILLNRSLSALEWSATHTDGNSTQLSELICDIGKYFDGDDEDD